MFGESSPGVTFRGIRCFSILKDTYCASLALSSLQYSTMFHRLPSIGITNFGNTSQFPDKAKMSLK